MVVFNPGVMGQENQRDIGQGYKLSVLRKEFWGYRWKELPPSRIPRAEHAALHTWKLLRMDFQGVKWGLLTGARESGATPGNTCQSDQQLRATVWGCGAAWALWCWWPPGPVWQCSGTARAISGKAGVLQGHIKQCLGASWLHPVMSGWLDWGWKPVQHVL